VASEEQEDEMIYMMSKEEATQLEDCEDADHPHPDAIQMETVCFAAEEQLQHEEELQRRCRPSRTPKLLAHVTEHRCSPPSPTTPEAVVVSENSSNAASDTTDATVVPATDRVLCTPQ
jgi:hypothetical protein